jgi:hypothetical protein
MGESPFSIQTCRELCLTKALDFSLEETGRQTVRFWDAFAKTRTANPVFQGDLVMLLGSPRTC